MTVKNSIAIKPSPYGDISIRNIDFDLNKDNRDGNTTQIDDSFKSVKKYNAKKSGQNEVQGHKHRFLGLVDSLRFE